MTAEAASLHLVNLGCGHRYHPEWINIDTAPQAPGIIKHDLSRGIPLADASSDAIYHSAVLEHFRRSDALTFLRECLRVLRPGGIIRVAVPDLEKLCQLYLLKLEAALDGDTIAVHDYDWIMLEMFDQTVREDSGGEMIGFFRQYPLPNEQFVYERIGQEGREIVESLRAGASERPSKRGMIRLAGQLGRTGLRRIRNTLLELLAGPDAVRALRIGRFRLGGEVHQWMYDRYSLSRLLIEAGFHSPLHQSAVSSQIPHWTSYNLDTLADGTVIKPDLFYMEAIRPKMTVGQ
ncbi:MAG TPA: methyltransferase domain-containing protein [Blastocatellia bacterium]|nr:methyltransferase domain-containing protein [Blastocatellia bacterium]